MAECMQGGGCRAAAAAVDADVDGAREQRGSMRKERVSDGLANKWTPPLPEHLMSPILPTKRKIEPFHSPTKLRAKYIEVY